MPRARFQRIEELEALGAQGPRFTRPGGPTRHLDPAGQVLAPAPVREADADDISFWQRLGALSGAVGDWLTTAVDAILTGADIGFEAAFHPPEPPLEYQLPGSIWERGPGLMTTAPLVETQPVRPEAGLAVSGAIELLERPVGGPLSAVLEPQRRIRMGEEPSEEGLMWYPREIARQWFHGIPGVGEPEAAPRFQIGQELARGPDGEPRWWSLLAGAAGNLLPLALYLAIGYGPASSRMGRAASPRAAARTGRFVGEVAGPEAAEATAAGFRRVMGEMLGRRQTVSDYVRTAQAQGRRISPADMALGERMFTETARDLLYRSAQRAGLSERLAQAATDRFMADMQWEMGPRLRLGGRPIRFWERPSRQPTGRWRFPEARATAAQAARAEIVEPGADAATTVNYRYYQNLRLQRVGRRIRDVAESRIHRPSTAAIEPIARRAWQRGIGVLERQVADLTERLRTVRPGAEEAAAAARLGRPLVAPEWEPSARGLLEPEAEVGAPGGFTDEEILAAERAALRGEYAQQPARPRAPLYEPSAREALAAEPTEGARRGLQVPAEAAAAPEEGVSPTEPLAEAPAAPQAPQREPWAVQTNIFGERETVARRPEAPPPRQTAMDQIAGGYAVERPEDTAEGMERMVEVERDVARPPSEAPVAPEPPAVSEPQPEAEVARQIAEAAPPPRPRGRPRPPAPQAHRLGR